MTEINMQGRKEGEPVWMKSYLDPLLKMQRKQNPVKKSNMIRKLHPRTSSWKPEFLGTE
jgi:hypothetical protein